MGEGGRVWTYSRESWDPKHRSTNSRSRPHEPPKPRKESLMTPDDPRHGTRRGYKTGAELTATPLFDEPGGAS